jgi:hypothetical protein
MFSFLGLCALFDSCFFIYFLSFVLSVSASAMPLFQRLPTTTMVELRIDSNVRFVRPQVQKKHKAKRLQNVCAHDRANTIEMNAYALPHFAHWPHDRFHFCLRLFFIDSVTPFGNHPLSSHSFSVK